MNQTRIATKRRRPGCLWRSRPPLRTPIKRPRLRVREYSLRGMTSPSRPPAPTALALFRFAVRRWGYCLRDTRRDVTADRPEDRRHHANGECHAEAYRVYGRVTGGCEGPRPPARGFALAPGVCGQGAARIVTFWHLAFGIAASIALVGLPRSTRARSRLAADNCFLRRSIRRHGEFSRDTNSLATSTQLYR